MARWAIIILFALAFTYTSAQVPADTLPNQTLDEVIVSATSAHRNLRAAEMGRHVLGKDAILKLPVLFGEPDVVKALQTLPVYHKEWRDLRVCMCTVATMTRTYFYITVYHFTM